MPSLTQLPPELHIQIIKNLKLFPATMLLRLTNKYFYNLIHPVSNDKMGLLEYKAYSDAHKFRYCEDCHRLRPGQKFMPSDLFPTVFEPRICIDCGMHNKSYVYPRGLVFESKRQVGVMCEDCPELPKGSLARLEDLCQECWTKVGAAAWDFPVVEERPKRGGGSKSSSETVSGYGEVASSGLLQEMLETI